MDVSEQLAPHRIGRYRLVDRLAIGGMAEVFLATEAEGWEPDPRTGLPPLVVIKRLLPHLAQQDEFVRAFAQEASIAMRIAHPNVVRMFELGEQAGLPFIAMEYVPGSSVRDLLAAAEDANEPLPIEVAVDLLCQACAGAHAAHELLDEHGRPAGLVHRDITPHNLMVDDAGRLVLLDFGIAKAADGDQTRTGVLKGKIAYMSPEQCRQEALDRRSDVFSLGVVGYQLLTGKKPFRGASELATMQAIIAGRYAPLRELRGDVPAPLARAVERAFAARPFDRFATAEALRTAVDLAARTAGRAPDPQRTAAIVRDRVGAAHDARHEALARALGDAFHVFPTDPRTQTESLDAPVLAPPAPSAAPRSTVWPVVGFGVAATLVAATLALVAQVGLRHEPAPVPWAGPPLVLAVAPTLGTDDLQADLEPLRAHLQQRMGRPVTLLVAPSYRAAAESVASGRTAYAVLPPAAAARVAQDAPLEVVAVKRVDGSTSSDGFLLVRRDDPATAVGDLRGRTACWTDAWSHTGYLLPREYLRAHRVDPDRDLTAHWSGNHEQALVDLLDGRCDVAATYSGNYETAAQRGIATGRLRILAITGRSRHDAVVAGPAAVVADTERLRDALLAFDPGKLGLPVGTERLTGFEPAPADYLRTP